MSSPTAGRSCWPWPRGASLEFPGAVEEVAARHLAPAPSALEHAVVVRPKAVGLPVLATCRWTGTLQNTYCYCRS